MQVEGMTFRYQLMCGIRFLRNWAVLCVVLFVVIMIYRDPFLIFWWPQTPAEGSKTAVLPLDMATESIDDMYDGCRSETASVIDSFGVFEWHVNINFSIAWALVERKAKKPMHNHLRDDHAKAVYMFTRFAKIRQDFNKAIKTGKHKYSTGRFKFHYLYFYLTDAVQALSKSQASCRTMYHRTWERFDQNIVGTNVRFGTFTWAVSSKQSFVSNGNVSCFEIYTCFGADITYYSSINQKGQVLIPTYEVFKVTDVLTNDPWCSVVYKLQSTKKPRKDQNCKLYPHRTESSFIMWMVHWHGRNVMSACFLLLMITSFVLVKHNQECYVAAVLGVLLVVIIVALMLS